MDRLKVANLTLDLETSAHLDDTAVVIELVGILLDDFVVTSSKKVKWHKPYPDIYLRTAGNLSLDVSQYLVIEEKVAKASRRNGFPGFQASTSFFGGSYSGARAGRAAGMKVIGMTTTYTPDELALYAELIISDFVDLDVAARRHMLDS